MRADCRLGVGGGPLARAELVGAVGVCGLRRGALPWTVAGKGPKSNVNFGVWYFCL